MGSDVCLHWLSMMNLEIPRTRNSFFFTAEYHSIIWTYHNLFIDSPVDWHLAFSLHSDIMNTAVKNICVQVSVFTYIPFILKKKFIENVYICVHEGYWPVPFSSCDVFVWFWYHGNAVPIEWVRMYLLLFKFWEEFA